MDGLLRTMRSGWVSLNGNRIVQRLLSQALPEAATCKKPQPCDHSHGGATLAESVSPLVSERWSAESETRISTFEFAQFCQRIIFLKEASGRRHIHVGRVDRPNKFRLQDAFNLRSWKFALAKP